MIRVTLSYLTEEEKERFIGDISKIQGYRIMKIRKGKEKRLYRSIHIDLSLK